jgi:hypothetical protein
MKQCLNKNKDVVIDFNALMISQNYVEESLSEQD